MQTPAPLLRTLNHPLHPAAQTWFTKSCSRAKRLVRTAPPLFLKLGVCAASALFITSAQAQVAGAGSSLVRELMTGWSGQLGAASGGVTYEPVGSSDGVQRAIEQVVDFGVTDVPLTAAALRQAGLRQLPLASVAVAVVVNLPELAGKPIKLTGDMLADIYMGNIKQWNHSVIVGANPGMNLPNKPIVPVWRSDGSGQSYIFSTYLARGNLKWRRTINVTNQLALTTGVSAKGGQGVLDTVKNTPGALGYDALGAAQRSGLGIAHLQNAAGKSIAPSSASIAEAVERAVWTKDSNVADLDGSAGAGAYPMAAVPYALLPLAPKKGRNTALPFIQASVAKGDEQVVKAGFVPLPPAIKTVVAATP